MRRRRSAAASAAVFAALALGACADDLEQFRDDLRPLEETAAGQRAETAARLRSVKLGSTRDARALRVHATQLAETYADIEQLEPPDDYEDPFAAYVRANDQLVRDLRRFADALAAADEPELNDASDDLVAALGKSQSAKLRWLE